jgi:hypothetical protein
LITVQKTAGSLDEKILRGSADGLVLLRVTLAGALPLELSVKMTRRARKRDFGDTSLSEFFNTIDV